jgi:hypothetical protein
VSIRGFAAIPTGLLLAAAFFAPANAEAACGTAPLFANLPPPPEITVSAAPEG